jgi:hypothetical protein
MTILQFRENLSDRKANAVIRTRVDLKYALHLPLNFPGFAPLALCKFRQRLINNRKAKTVFFELISRMKELLGNDHQLLEEIDQMLMTICTLNRLESMFESMSQAIESLEISQPEWLCLITLPHWHKRYERNSSFLFFRWPLSIMEELLESISEDGQYLLSEIDSTRNAEIENLSAIQFLRLEWQRQFDWQSDTLKLRELICYSHNNCFKMTHESIQDCPIWNKEDYTIVKRKQA